MAEVRSPVLVQTKSGPIRGQTKKTFDGLDYVCFQGIPFAKPPLGQLRFKKPEPIDKWTEPWDAFVAPPAAAATTYDNARMDPLTNEDCLYLNISTPNVGSDKRRPVMVYIYGGGFFRGSVSDPRRGPDFLLRNDVVIVQVAYRVGALGFLSVSEPRVECPGNAGLKDQTLGIRWVADNIESFGGDPNNITVFGGSAGAVSVHLHMLSEYSNGLFHKAIIQSGCAATPIYQRSDQCLDEALARKLGWNGEGGADAMMAVLLDAKVEDIVVQQCTIDTDTNPGSDFVFLPIVEPYVGPDCFLPATPSELVKSASWGNTIPMIIGYNAHEAQFWFPDWRSPENEAMFRDDQIFYDFIPHGVSSKLTNEERKQRVDAMKRFYYGDTVPSFENLPILSRLVSDVMFLQPIVASIRTRRNQPGCAATYLYRFSFDSLEPIFAGPKIKCGQDCRGAMHAEELMYMFRRAGLDYTTLKDDCPEWRTIHNVVNLWTTFAATGNPNDAKVNGLRWDDYNGQPWDAPTRCLSLSDTVQMIDMPEEDSVNFTAAMYDINEQ